MRRRTVCGRLGGPLALASALLVLVSACTVGPDYVRPSMISPDAYKELDGWKIAHPRDGLARGPWWEIFADPQLNALEARVSISNQNLAV
ncbi:MAG TPA: RND transporter, partial [Methylomirabilota bacterium]|nr:RND transporter [Methylomirabilota bacterium]